MTTFERTYQHDINRDPSQSTIVGTQAYFVWYFKAFLKGEIGGATLGLWTCIGSSDSVTAALDGSDRWTSTFTLSKIVFGTGVHSWIVLQSPAGLGSFYMCLDYNTAQPYQLSVFFSKTAFTGGSTSARPTSTTEWGYASQKFQNSTTGPAATFSRLHGTLATNGMFSILASEGQGFFNYALAFFELADTKTGEAHNGWSYCCYYTFGGIAGGAWNHYTMSGVAFEQALKGRNFNNTVTVGALLPMYIGNGNVEYLDVSNVGNMPSQDATDGLWCDLPVHLFVYTAAHMSLRGRMKDIRMVSANIGLALQGRVEPAGGVTPQSMAVGGFWFPTNAVPLV